MTFDLSLQGMAYLTLHPGKSRWAGRLRTFETLINYILILLGIFILGPGIYVCRYPYCPSILIYLTHFHRCLFNRLSTAIKPIYSHHLLRAEAMGYNSTRVSSRRCELLVRGFTASGVYTNLE